MKNSAYASFVNNFFIQELAQDGEDITSKVLFGAKKIPARAQIVAKESGVLAGQEEVMHFFSFAQKWRKKDGAIVKKGDTLAEFTADAQEIIKAERVILNFLSRMSGIATMTKKVAEKLPKGVAVAATRKTLWGVLDKKAVSIGGGLTHRLGLNDAILIKENHLALLAGGAKEAMEKVARAPENLGAFWEIEVETAEEFFAALKTAPHKHPGVIMFDNFPAKKIALILARTPQPKNIFFEASGGINEKNVLAYAKTGVAVLSCGFLTKNAHSLDFSLDIERL